MLLLPSVNMFASDIIITKNRDRTVLLANYGHAQNRNETSIEMELSGEGEMVLSDGAAYKTLRFSAGERPVKIYLYTGLTGIRPESITLTGDDFDVISANITKRKNNTPLPADIGHIIFSDFDQADSWVVYKWNILPEVLIFDTRDYSIQSRLFKRLAFFVEKPGYTGKLVSNEELEGKHGWNAHDYRPEDLAGFFSKAEAENFSLNQEELELKKELLDNGIIVKAPDKKGYSAGKGAVLSVSRETLPNWRYRFLTHECLHAIFFTDEGFRSEIFRAFYELAPEEIEFWKHLLDYRQYDVENSYLLVNEFMAYSLQQPIEETNEYFKGFLYTRMIAARPYEEDFVENFDNNFPDSFISAVYRIEKILYSHTGSRSGHLANLFPEETNDSFFDLFPPITK